MATLLPLYLPLLGITSFSSSFFKLSFWLGPVSGLFFKKSWIFKTQFDNFFLGQGNPAGFCLTMDTFWCIAFVLVCGCYIFYFVFFFSILMLILTVPLLTGKKVYFPTCLKLKVNLYFSPKVNSNMKSWTLPPRCAFIYPISAIPMPLNTSRICKWVFCLSLLLLFLDLWGSQFISLILQNVNSVL